MCTVIVCALLTYFLVFPLDKAWASEQNIETKDEIVLNRETVTNLAVKNYSYVIQNQLQIRSQAAQMVYLNAQRSKAAASVQVPSSGLLPVALEELTATIPDYEQLTEEEKGQLQSILVIQSMINASLNQYIEAKAEQQYAELLLGQQQTIESLDEQLRSASGELQASSIEAEKVKQLVQFYALQSCYDLLLLRNDMEAANVEAEYWEQKLTDARLLQQAGLGTVAEVEEAEVKTLKQQKIKNGLVRQYEFKLKMLKLDLGIDPSQTIVLQGASEFRLSEEVRGIDVELDNQFDIRKSDAAIHQVQSDYERLLQKDRELANYYLIAIGIEKDNKAASKRELEKRLAQMTEEGNLLAQSIVDAVDEKARFLKQKERYLTLLQYGQITIRELEELEYQIAKLDCAIRAAELQYEVWKEKKWSAIHGLLM